MIITTAEIFIKDIKEYWPEEYFFVREVKWFVIRLRSLRIQGRFGTFLDLRKIKSESVNDNNNNNIA